MEHPIYEPSGLALEIFKKRYAIHEAETFGEAADRVAYHVAQAEQGEKIGQWRTKFADTLARNLFIPGGRISYGSGRPKGQLLNCFVIPNHDSREGWGKTTSDMMVISGVGGGVGQNYSPIRPRGSKINGAGGLATGAVSLMRIHNSVGQELKGGGGRRVALMMALEHDHGDIEEFLDAKLDRLQLNNANISVMFQQDPERFFELVRKDLDYDLKFGGKVLRRISARKIWDRIIENALKSGEPGILNFYLANRMSNIGYYKPLICTNPCGEVTMEEFASCCLGHVVLPRFADLETGEIDWDGLRDTVAIGVRFLDDVLSVNNYPLQEIKEESIATRRIGLGVTGLHDLLLICGLRYNSAEGLELADRVMAFVKNAAYEASIDLAIEKGPFPKFDPDRFLKGGFAKTLRPSLRERMRKHGIRHCATMTVAPVGTGSMVSGITLEICGVTSGIEPMFAPAYNRRHYDGDRLQEDVVVHPLFKWFLDHGRDVSHFQGSHQIRLRDHFEMQRVVQRHVDQACSKTINIPQGTSAAELSELFMEFLPELKGVTVYPEGSRENQPLTPLDLDEAIVYCSLRAGMDAAAAESKCRSGVCEI